MKTLILLGFFLFLVVPNVRADQDTPLDTVLPNGIRIIAQQESNTQLVAINIFIRPAGQPGDAPRAGVGSYVASTLLAGTSNQNEETITSAIGALGGNVHATWQPDLTQIKALTLSSQFDEAAYLLSDVLKNADFRDAAVEAARTDLLAEQQSRADDLFQTTYDTLRAALYAGTPYGEPEVSPPDVIKRITPSELRSYFQQTFVPGNVVISVVGNVPTDHVAQTFEGDLTDFTRSVPRARPAPPIAFVPHTQAAIVKHYRSDLTAGVIMAGYLAPGAGSPDYPAMLVANALLGGMKTSLLFVNLRTKKGYGYEVASLYPNQRDLSDLTAYIISAPSGKSGASGFGEIKDALMDQFHLLREAAPAAADLARAKRYLIGSYLLAHERLEDRAYYLGYSEIAQKPLGGYRFDTHYADVINAVTADEVQRVSRKYLTDGSVLSMLLPGDPRAGIVAE